MCMYCIDINIILLNINFHIYTVHVSKTKGYNAIDSGGRGYRAHVTFLSHTHIHTHTPLTIKVKPSTGRCLTLLVVNQTMATSSSLVDMSLILILVWQYSVYFEIHGDKFLCRKSGALHLLAHISLHVPVFGKAVLNLLNQVLWLLPRLVSPMDLSSMHRLRLWKPLNRQSPSLPTDRHTNSVHKIL